jgi:hypothetical protein
MWSVKLVAEDNPTENARGEIYGHDVSARDPRLALRIAARYPGISLHTDYFEYEYANDTEITSENGLEIKEALEKSIGASASEPMPGLAATMGETGAMMGIAAITGQDAKPPPVPFVEPVSASLDSYTAIGTCALDRLHEATLIRAPAEILASLAVHLTFPDAISAIRRTDPDRLPIWLDFTSIDGDPERRSYPAGLAQPLYGVLIDHEEDESEGGPFHAVIPIGRNVGLREEATALCALAVGPDDGWRFPVPEGVISLITAHRGGVAVRHANTKHTSIGITPEITASWAVSVSAIACSVPRPRQSSAAPRSLTVRFGSGLDQSLLEETIGIEQQCSPFFTFDYSPDERLPRIGVERADQDTTLDALAFGLGGVH